MHVVARSLPRAFGPTAQDHYRNGTVAKVSLIRNILIRRYDHVEPDAFGSNQAFSVQLILRPYELRFSDENGLVIDVSVRVAASPE
jgi:hypothetical protein